MACVWQWMRKFRPVASLRLGLTKDVTPIHRTKKFQLKLAFEHTTVDFLIQVPIITFVCTLCPLDTYIDQ